MTSPATDSVHWTQPGLAVLVEGKDGHGDTCAPIAMLAYRAIAHGVVMSDAVLDDSRRELIAWGLMDTPGEPGMTVSAVAVALGDHYGSPPLTTVGYSPLLNLDMFHADLKGAMAAHQAVIVELADGAALPGNQGGVQYHFILIWGIDSAQGLGYYCANGDLLSAITAGETTTQPIWYTWDNLASAKPCGYVILPAVEPSAAPEIVITEAPGEPEPTVTLAGNRWEVSI